MRLTLPLLTAACAICLTARANDKPVEIRPGEAIPASLITTNHLSPFKHDLPAVLPMVVVSFQTQATEKAGSSLLGSGGIQYTLDGISGSLMQKIADEAQAAVEAELQAAGWQILPPEKATATAVYQAWSKSPDPSREEVKRQFYSAGRGTNTFSSKELERVYVGGGRALVGNGVVLGGWTAGGSFCQIGQALGAKVILVRFIVNFANISAGKRGLFSGQEWKGKTDLEISHSEMDVYPPDATGATPARLTTEKALTLHSEFIREVLKSSGGRTIVADPVRYETDIVEAVRCVARGFAAQSGK